MKIEMTPKKYPVEIPGYGEFEITQFGAGAEAEIRIAMRELNESMESNKKFQDIIDREKNGEKIDQDSKEYKEAIEAFNNTSKLIEKVQDLTLEKMRYVIKGKNADKLFNDFTYDEISELYSKAIN